MCMIIEKSSEAIVAQEDVVVFKILREATDNEGNNLILSPFRMFVYKRNKVYTSELECSEKGHPYCFEEIDFYNLTEPYYLPDDMHYIAKGIHCFSTYTQAKRHARCDYFGSSEYEFYSDSVYKCIIPKGSVYYQSRFGTIATNKMIIKRKLS